MKKIKLVTIVLLCLFVVAVILFVFFWEHPSIRSGAEAHNSSLTESLILSAPKDTLLDIRYLLMEGNFKESTSETEASTIERMTSEAEDSPKESTSEIEASTIESMTPEAEDRPKASTTETEASTIESITAKAENSPKESITETEVPTIESITATTEDNPKASILETETSNIESITTQINSDISMDDALFIGDSRTVGLMEYAGIDGADYFCTVGMSVYNIHKKTASVPNAGKMTLMDLLNSKKYGKIYIMLGINEVGYEFSITVKKYGELIELIKEKQADAVIFIQANLHVTKSRSDSDKVINNNAINGLNAELEKLADGKNKFYLDANILFDDKTGGLSSEKSADSVHLYAKYYSEWGKWIIRQTSSLIGEG